MKRDICHLCQSVSHSKNRVEPTNFNCFALNQFFSFFFFFVFFYSHINVTPYGVQSIPGEINCSETRLEQG